MTGQVQVWHIFVLALGLGVVNSFDMPIRQAFVIEMVEHRTDLPNAIALNSSMVTGSRIIGPTIGGVLIAAFGEGWCFMVDAVSYIAVIVSLLAMRVTIEHRKSATRMLDEMRDGVRYVWGFVPARTVLLLLALVSTMGMPYMVLMPAVASDILHGGPHTLGFLMTASGVGALIGALYLATRASVLGLGRAIPIAAITFGVGLSAFAFSHVLWLSLLLLPIVGGGFMVETAATNTILQTIVEERLRGRVMAFYAMAFLGTAPIGSLVAGVVADRIGVPWTIFVGGVACMAAGVWFWLQLPALRAKIRPIYVERGIIAAGGPEADAEAI